MKNYDECVQNLKPEFKQILGRIPKIGFERLPPDWLHWQIIERFTVLDYAGIEDGSNILEIGCGSHAIATIALAALVREKGRVVAVDIGRWCGFWDYVKQSGLSARVIPLQADARDLPLPFSCFDLTVCVHGIRSFDGRESVLKAVKEMLRVTKERIFIAESAPIAKTRRQEAHLAMYNLRHPTFTALGKGYLGDIPYFTPEELKEILTEAGASKIEMELVDVNMPHHLAWFPLDMIKNIENGRIRNELEERWKKAVEMLDLYGEEHPPVVVMNAWK